MSPRSPVGAALLHLWRLARPEVWMVSFLPMYVGWLLSTHELLPGFRQWLAFWAGAATEGATSADFFAAFSAWWPSAAPFLMGLVVMGPLLWTATLLLNDAYDLEGDRVNPRKAGSPLVQGLVTRGFALRGAGTAAVLALGTAAFVGVGFLATTAACLALAWAYSAPPLRLKTRPGADVLVNAFGVGVLAFLGGWSLGAPLAEVPWPFLPQGLLVAAAVYIPTTLVDHDADVSGGYTTFATRLGPRTAYSVGLGCWVGANVGALALSWADVILPRGMFLLLVVFCPLLVWEYHEFVGKARDAEARIKGIILASLTFLAVNLVFALMYTGLWTGA